MSFILCQIQPLEDNRIGIRRIRALVLGGEKGLLSRYLPALAKNGDGNWSLTAHELVMAENPGLPDDTRILFDLTPKAAEQKNFLSLVDVCGRTMSLVTDALFRFKVLAPIEAQGGSPSDFYTAKNRLNDADRYEQMRLEGGFAGGNWSWSEPPLAIGATVLHPISSENRYPARGLLIPVQP